MHNHRCTHNRSSSCNATSIRVQGFQGFASNLARIPIPILFFSTPPPAFHSNHTSIMCCTWWPEFRSDGELRHPVIPLITLYSRQFNQTRNAFKRMPFSAGSCYILGMAPNFAQSTKLTLSRDTRHLMTANDSEQFTTKSMMVS